MTRNELAYWELQETKRSNRAREIETNRANVAMETENNRSNLARERETNRSNQAREIQNRIDSNRNYRIQEATLDQRKYEFYMNNQLAQRQQREVERANKANEDIKRDQNTVQILQYGEQRRTNIANENIKRDQLQVTIGQNRVSNVQNAFNLQTQRYNAEQTAAINKEKNRLQQQSNSYTLAKLQQDREVQLRNWRETNRHNLATEDLTRSKYRYEFVSNVVKSGFNSITSVAKLATSRR